MRLLLIAAGFVLCCSLSSAEIDGIDSSGRLVKQLDITDWGIRSYYPAGSGSVSFERTEIPQTGLSQGNLALTPGDFTRVELWVYDEYELWGLVQWQVLNDQATPVGRLDVLSGDPNNPSRTRVDRPFSVVFHWNESAMRLLQSGSVVAVDYPFDISSGTYNWDPVRPGRTTAGNYTGSTFKGSYTNRNHNDVAGGVFAVGLHIFEASFDSNRILVDTAALGVIDLVSVLNATIDGNPITEGINFNVYSKTNALFEVDLQSAYPEAVYTLQLTQTDPGAKPVGFQSPLNNSGWTDLSTQFFGDAVGTIGINTIYSFDMASTLASYTSGANFWLRLKEVLPGDAPGGTVIWQTGQITLMLDPRVNANITTLN